jgi:membrane-associated protease RseP (regulator of RpoE activity)
VDDTSLGETEYRCNWVPLGGYVKMVGQEDLNPEATSAEQNGASKRKRGKRK